MTDQPAPIPPPPPGPSDRPHAQDRPEQPPTRRRRRAWKWLAGVLIVLFGLLLVLRVARFEYAYMPSMSKVMNPQRINLDHAYDLWGRTITHDQAQRLLQTDEGRAMLSPANGAIEITPQLLQLGREAFYRETFGNEIFLQDIGGLDDVPITPWEYIKALLRLRGRGTNNLQVRLSETVTVGGRTLEKGTVINTGVDVPRGAWFPIGFKLSYDRGKMRMGITCAACHSTVDPATGMVIEGATNHNFNAGLMLAMASNSAAYFTNAELPPLEEMVRNPDRTIVTSTGERVALPDPRVLEEHVDSVLIRWPPGFFDSSIDLVANPTKVPDAWTWMDHPYSWTGATAAGPFRGLSALGNNVHAVNSDGISEALLAEELYGMDPEIFYALILQNAPGRFHYDPLTDERRPSEFFTELNPTPPLPGVTELAALPTFPRGSIMSTHGMIVSSPGHTVWEQINAISAFQNTLQPPPAPVELDERMVRRGREVFVQADCISCHAGTNFNTHEVLPASEVGTNPSRARGSANTERVLDFPPLVWAWDTPVPVPDDARPLEVPLDHLDPEQIRLSLAHDDLPGGYKIKGLIGVYYNAPYLHDGAVAVGPDDAAQLGLPGTLMQGILPDPANSLRALIDRGIRQRVIDANREAGLHEINVEGVGHEHWVDQAAGFAPQDQDALIQYLFSLSFDDAERAE